MATPINLECMRANYNAALLLWLEAIRDGRYSVAERILTWRSAARATLSAATQEATNAGNRPGTQGGER